MKSSRSQDLADRGKGEPRPREEGRAVGVLVPLVPACWTSGGKGSRTPAIPRGRGKRSPGLVLALPPPIRLPLPDAEGSPPRSEEAGAGREATSP